MKTSLPKSLYIELLKKVLISHSNIGSFEHHPLKIVNSNWKTAFLYPLDRLLRKRNFAITKLKFVLKEKRLNGYDWPANADTMIGLGRLNNIEDCFHSIIKDNVPGDFIEAGVWRGGAAILMKALLKEFKVVDKKVWLADSFQGLPKPNMEKFSADKGNNLYKLKILNVGLDEVKNNFRKYDLLDQQVVFLKGWFKDVLPTASMEKIALLRLDADMYESTLQALTHLYPKLSLGGYIIIDDYHAFPNCKQAVDEYRKAHLINTPIIKIDAEAIFWRRDI